MAVAAQEFPARPAPGSAEIPLCVTETDAAAPEAVCGKAPTMATYRVTPPWGEPDEECAIEVFQGHGAQEGVTRSRGPRRSPSWRGARAPIAGAGWFPRAGLLPRTYDSPGVPVAVAHGLPSVANPSEVVGWHRRPGYSPSRTRPRRSARHSRRRRATGSFPSGASSLHPEHHGAPPFFGAAGPQKVDEDEVIRRSGCCYAERL